MPVSELGERLTMAIGHDVAPPIVLTILYKIDITNVINDKFYLTNLFDIINLIKLCNINFYS